MKIRGLQITAGTTIKFDDNIIYVKDFREMTVDTKHGSYVITEEDLFDFIRNMDNKDKDIVKINYFCRDVNKKIKRVS